MKRVTKILGLALVVTAILVVALTGTVFAENSLGPAPSSGDCIPEGSGFGTPPGADIGPGMGPAPNAGLGISEGSGF